MSVLVLDAAKNAGIAVIRSLGRKSIDVIAADSSPRAIGLRSRYVKEKLIYPDPLENVNVFTSFMKLKLEELVPEFIIAVTDRTLVPLCYNPEIIPKKTILASPQKDTLELTLDKIKTYYLAETCGVPTPKAHFMGTYAKDKLIPNIVRYPVVVKPSRSKVWIGKKGYSLSISYANNQTELINLLSEYSSFGEVTVQEYVLGTSCGIEILADKGHICVAFQHNRLREFPLTGGASSLRESAPLNSELFEYTKKLVNKLNWTGVLMVEYKCDEYNKKSYLIEINGRFWGSLALAISSGVDFPYYLYLLMVKNQNIPQPDYKIGIRAKAIAKEISWVENVMRKRPVLTTMKQPTRREALKVFSKLIEPKMNYDFQAWDDPMPGIFELVDIGYKYMSRLLGVAPKAINKLQKEL